VFLFVRTNSVRVTIISSNLIGADGILLFVRTNSIRVTIISFNEILFSSRNLVGFVDLSPVSVVLAGYCGTRSRGLLGKYFIAIRRGITITKIFSKQV
jgi:hypothetical protein